MIQFFFNDCLPCQSNENVASLFKEVMLAYLDLHKNKNLDIDRTLCISQLPENTTICGNKLNELISNCAGNREEKNALVALFRTATILEHQYDDFVDPDNIYKSFTFNGRNALYLAIAAANQMVSISLPLEDAVKANALYIEVFDTIENKHEASWSITNWYKYNTETILTNFLPQAKTQLDKLRNYFVGIGKNVLFSEKFIDQWDHEIRNDSMKGRIIKRFSEAYNCKLLFPAIEDPREPKYKIVRKDNSGNTEIFELRLRDIGVRIYFTCDDNTIRIILYGTKTSHQGCDQESDFRAAYNIAKNSSLFH